MAKCRNCPYALPIHGKYWVMAKKGTELWKAQKEAKAKGGFVCTGDLTVHLPSEKGDYRNCPMYKLGKVLFEGG